LQNYAEEIYITLSASNGDQLPILCNATKIEIESGSRYSCVGIIVKHRKQFEDELISAKKIAEKALSENTELNKVKEELIRHTETLDRSLTMVNRQNQELMQFNRAVTHDLQEPLRKISLFLNMMQHGVTDNSIMERDKIADKVIKVSKDMQQVVSGLQEYIWVHERGSHIEAIDLNTILNGVKKKLITEEGEDNFQLEIEDLPEIDGDKTQIQLLLYHLLKNAIRFRKKNEKAYIRLNATIIKQNKYKNLKDHYSFKDHLKLEIEDKGVGFDPEYRIEIFDLFKKLHHNAGKGVGLALCRMITENHHGQIYADSKPGEGTTITVLLPIGLNVGLNDKVGEK